MAKKTFVVIFRTGGSARFTWNRSLEFASREEAERSRESVERMGYCAFVEDAARSLAIGLPETFEPRSTVFPPEQIIEIDEDGKVTPPIAGPIRET